jgi:hypothetical protein
MLLCYLIDLLAAAAVSGGMLSGSRIYGYDNVGPEANQAPWESELQVVAMARAGAAWLRLVERCQRC